MAAIDQGLLRPGKRLITRWWKRVGVWLAGGILLLSVLVGLTMDTLPRPLALSWKIVFEIYDGDYLLPILLLCWLIPVSIALRSYDELIANSAVPQGKDKYLSKLVFVLYLTRWSILATTLLSVIYPPLLDISYIFSQESPGIWSSIHVPNFYMLIGTVLYGMWHVLLLLLLPQRQYLVWGLVAVGVIAPFIRYLPGGSPLVHVPFPYPQPDAYDSYIWILGLAILLGMLVAYRLRQNFLGHILYGIVVLAVIRPYFPDGSFGGLPINFTGRLESFLSSMNSILTHGIQFETWRYNFLWIGLPYGIDQAIWALIFAGATAGLVYFVVFFLPRRCSKSNE